MNKQKPKYRISWPTNLIFTLVVVASLILAYGNARSGEYGRMIDELCFLAVVLCYWNECYWKTKAWNVAHESIRINDQLVDINTKLAEHATAALNARDRAVRKAAGLLNAVRTAATCLRTVRAKNTALTAENVRLVDKLDAYETKEVRG